ncbi:MAG TPA: T9SS type A sorting domain-containing protein [Candidatus Eisenbacteria bacterium]|nr:T9SS type A sorting domain-containing protein [Candidatus Eisenbacteria bacterium]
MHSSARRTVLSCLALVGLVLVLGAVPAVAQEEDPDLPGWIQERIDKSEYLKARQAQIAQLLGAGDWVSGGNPRLQAIREMRDVQSQLGPVATGFWTPLGPAPIPNGQTVQYENLVSGRVSAIAIHPANPDIAYVGAAQGGVYRTLDGGATWTAIFDDAASLAIGALALAPSDPGILYVGTGEGNGSCDSFFGVGLYRIDAADTAPVLNGPFNPTPINGGAKTFTGRAISRILVDPANPAIVFASTVGGVGGLGCEALPGAAVLGLYRSADATSASPGFTKLTVASAGDRGVSDMVYDPTDPTHNTLVCWVQGGTGAGDGGIHRTTNALASPPAFTQTFQTTANFARGALSVVRIGGVTTMMVATGESAAGTGCTTGSGALRKSMDGGVTWGAKLAAGGGFCGGQCWYDIAIAICPNDASVILIGGQNDDVCARILSLSTDGGASFSGPGVVSAGLHADAHVIAFAPSNPQVVYFGNDGGIFRSTNRGVSWTSINTAGFNATQFQSLALHPLDRWFTIGGTQDNGTPFYRPDQTWIRADWGDGGFAQIDRNAPNTTNVRMYHTYFNQRNLLVGYARVTHVNNAWNGLWTFLGNGQNGISIDDNVLFYAPLALGPGNPSTIYYGTQRLYRSADGGDTHTTASQNPIGPGVISAIGISPQDDKARIVGTTFGRVLMTQTGSSTLTDVTSPSMPSRFVTRTVFDPNDVNAAWACFTGFGLPPGHHIWKTTNLAGGAATWSASGFGLPDAPVNAFAIDALHPLEMYAGTDVGVYKSSDGGASWVPFTTGMPVVAVFDMAIQPVYGVLRVATHGRGIWERDIYPSTVSVAALVRSEVRDGHVLLSWHTDLAPGTAARLYRRYVPGDWQPVATLHADAAGDLAYDDGDLLAEAIYDYRLGLPGSGGEVYAGDVRVDLGAATRLSVAGAHPNPSTNGLKITFTLPRAMPATIEVVDATGRRVVTREVGGMGVGRHELDLGRERLAPGVYWARLVQGDRMSAAKLVVLASGR